MNILISGFLVVLCFRAVQAMVVRYSTIDMFTWCSLPTDVAPRVHLAGFIRFEYWPAVNCQVRIISELENSRISLRFLDLNIESTNSRRCIDSLSIYDGNFQEGVVLATVCGSVVPPEVLSSGQQLVLVMTSDNSGNGSFRILYSVFVDSVAGSCPTNGNYSTCADGRCMPGDLVNDGHENCPDGEDEDGSALLEESASNGQTQGTNDDDEKTNEDPNNAEDPNTMGKFVFLLSGGDIAGICIGGLIAIVFVGVACKQCNKPGRVSSEMVGGTGLHSVNVGEEVGENTLLETV
ncbi:NETO1 [Branchiostoma lanceolatum]|uniref:NETO1 protein n=1 Tax=Branchiostoma lanceolatum TaxID=7740 RepID=A0A8K0F169_BRALA|nr:NETO1 [Branchiostoma lanceolatum]